MNALQFLILTLATWQAVEIWRHGSIMAPLRLRLDIDVPPPLVPERVHASARNLLRCPFCLSVWVAAWFYASWEIGHILLESHGSPAARACGQFFGVLPILGISALAISRAANLLNDLTYPYQRTYKSVPDETPAA